MNDDKHWRKGLWLYEIWFFILRYTFGIFIRIKYRYTFDRFKPKSKTFIAMANHNSEADQYFLVIALKRYLRFVASDHLLRKGFTGSLLKFFAGPIAKRKGGDQGETTEKMIQNLRAGVSVAIYPEGNRSFTGETGFISPRTGQLVKDCRQGLVTFRLEGGYTQSPRWAKYPRKGPVHGHVVGQYTARELEKLTASQINDLIARDLYINAYEIQRQSPRPYPGKAKAEMLETAIYLCPKCGGLGTLKSSGDDFFCRCGYKVTVNDYGFFDGEAVVFDNCLDWDSWQRAEYKKLLLSKPLGCGEMVTKDENQKVFSVDRAANQRTPVSDDCTLSLFRDRLQLSFDGGEISLPMDKITGMSVIKHMNLAVTSNMGYYEIISPYPRSALKYLAAWRYLTGKEYR